MLSLKFISSTLRGASALASSQTGGMISNTTNIQSSPNQSDSVTKPLHRAFGTSFTIGGFWNQAAETEKSTNKAESKAISVPDKPKKPFTAWIAFVRDRKDDVLRQKSKMTAAELAVILSKEWKELDKSRYLNEFQARKDNYHRQIEQYNMSLNDEQRQHLESLKENRREVKTMRQLKKTRPPVLPRNPANFYCQERIKDPLIQDQLKHKSMAQILKDVFEQYRVLPDHKKKRFVEMQAEDKTRFQHEFNLWFESIQNDHTLTKAVLEKAEKMRDRYKALKYI